jgi:hypothetical protein
MIWPEHAKFGRFISNIAGIGYARGIILEVGNVDPPSGPIYRVSNFQFHDLLRTKLCNFGTATIADIAS